MRNKSQAEIEKDKEEERLKEVEEARREATRQRIANLPPANRAIIAAIARAFGGGKRKGGQGKPYCTKKG